MKRALLAMVIGLIVIAMGAMPVLAQLIKVEMSSFDKPSFGHTTATLLSANKFDEKNGVKIIWKFKKGRAANLDFAAGRDKISLASALLSEANRRNKGVKSVYLFGAINFFGAVLTHNPAIKSLKDLEGKTIAANTVTTNYALFRYFAMKAGVDLSKIRVQSSNTPGLATYLLAKRADAVHVWEPNFSKLLYENPGKLYPIEYVDKWRSYGNPPLRGYLGVAAHEDWIAGNRKTIQKIYNAFKDLGAWLPSHHDEAAAIISKATGIAKPALLNAIKAKRYSLQVVPSDAIKANIKAVFKAGIEIGYMKKMPDDGFFYSGLK